MWSVRGMTELACCSVPQRSRIEGDSGRGDIVVARSCNMVTLRRRTSFPNNYPFHTASYLSSHSCSLHISTTSLAPIILFSSPRPPSHLTTHHAPPPPGPFPPAPPVSHIHTPALKKPPVNSSHLQVAPLRPPPRSTPRNSTTSSQCADTCGSTCYTASDVSPQQVAQPGPAIP